MKITLFTLARNTGHRLEEWIHFHNKIGVDEFLIHLDYPTDDSEERLKSLQKIYNVSYEVLPKDGNYYDGDLSKWEEEHGSLHPIMSTLIPRQLKAANKALDFLKLKYKGVDHWTAFHDVDEFLVPQKEMSLKNIVKKYQGFYDRIVAYDYRFDQPSDLFGSYLENSTIRRPVTNIVSHWPTRKSLVKTRYCGKIKCQHDMDQSPYLIIDDELKLNHYREEASFPKESYFIEDMRALEILKSQVTEVPIY